jgi:ParB/RepB/Spo0J family partition protein
VSPVDGHEGYYFILSGGHQRRDAAREAGLEKIPVFVNATPQEKKQLGLRLARENTAQVNRSPVNLGFLYLQLIEEFGMTQDEIARAIKRDRYHVNFAIMAARSASDIRAALREKYSPRVMTYLRRVETPEERAPIIAQYLAGELTVDGVRTAVETVQTEKKPASTPSARQQVGETKTGADKEQKTTPSPEQMAPPGPQHPQTLLQQARALIQPPAEQASEREAPAETDPRESQPVSEQIAKAQAVFSRIETYRRYIDKLRADGTEVMLSDTEALLLGKIIDRCHTLLDTYGKKLS